MIKYTIEIESLPGNNVGVQFKTEHSEIEKLPYREVELGQFIANSLRFVAQAAARLIAEGGKKANLLECNNQDLLDAAMKRLKRGQDPSTCNPEAQN